MDKYLNVINDAIPVFNRSRFLSDVTAVPYSSDLVLTILAITAKLTGFVFTSEAVHIDNLIDSMLSSSSLQEDMFGDAPTLDQMRRACLLAFYEFHQFPGHQAWMRIGKLTRIAYWVGLDRKDNSRPRYAGWKSMHPRETNDWRLVWWCIYRLDSYACLSSGTPYLIDEGLVNTALMPGRESDGADADQTMVPGRDLLFLTPMPDDLRNLVPMVASGPLQESLFNFHILTSTLLRHVGRALRVSILNPRNERFPLLADLERRLSAFRLALPVGYLSPMRNAMANEDRSAHHARLITVLHLLMARLLIFVLRTVYTDDAEDEWLLRWQQVLETCQDIALVSEQWDSSFTLSVDPAISFILFTAAIFLDLHSKSETTTAPGLHANIEHCEDTVLLHLEQFASMWTLPTLLIRERPLSHTT